MKIKIKKLLLINDVLFYLNYVIEVNNHDTYYKKEPQEEFIKWVIMNLLFYESKLLNITYIAKYNDANYL